MTRGLRLLRRPVRSASLLSPPGCEKPLGGGPLFPAVPLLDRIRHYAKDLAWKLLDDRPEISFATLGDDAGFIGAAGCAWEAHRTGDW